MLYDRDKIRECFEEPDERWANEPDDIAAMQCGYRSHALLMGNVTDEFERVLEENWGVGRVLDVGCGPGVFLDHVRERNLLHRLEAYYGYDVAEQFIFRTAEKMRELGVRGDVLHEDVFDPETGLPTVELVIATQCLNTVFSSDKYVFLETALARLWSCTRRRLVFDLKDIAAPQHYKNREYYEPSRVLDLCRGLTQNISYRQITKSNFAIVLSREELT